jgi:membrane-bound lytic murein transglycosylase MltF
MIHDLLQMVNAGLIPATATTERRANLWSQVLPRLVVHSDLVLASGEQTGWAVRKNSPQLKQLLDEYIAPRALGTSFGNTLLHRYLQHQVGAGIHLRRGNEEVEALQALFQKYAGQYDFDYLMIMAQGYQESLLDQSKRNPSGAGTEAFTANLIVLFYWGDFENGNFRRSLCSNSW